MDWGWCVRISWRRGWVSAVCCVLVTHLTRKMKNLVRDTLAVVLLMVCFKNIWRLCSPCWRWENYCSCSADISWKRSKHPEQSRGKLNKSILRQSLSIRTSINRSLVRLSLMFGQWTCIQRCTLHKIQASNWGEFFEPVAPDETNRLMMEEFLQNRSADGSWKKSIRILIWSLTTQYCCIIVRPFAAGELLNLTSNWSCTRKDFHPVLQKFNLWRFIVLISDRVSRIFCLFRRITCQGGNWKS